MKIAINAIPYTSWQGIEVFLSGLLDSWPYSASDEVIVFANQESAAFLKPLPNHVRIKIINFKKISRLRLFTYQQFIFPFVLNKDKFDLLFCPSLLSPWLYQKKIVTIHDAAPFVLKMENGLIGKIFWRINLFFGKLFSLKIITVSNFSKKELIESLGIKPNKIEVIYNATQKYDGLSNSFNLKFEKINYIVTVGNARPRKNLDSLLKAFSLLKEEITDIKLIVIGKKDKYMKTLEKKYNSMEGYIFFKGFVSEVEKKIIIKNSKALVLPSLYEGFGLPILEAEALNVPVICSDIPAFREIAQDSALFFNPKDTGDIKEKIKLVLQSESISNKLKNKGSENANRFNWGNSASSLLKIIHQYENTTNK